MKMSTSSPPELRERLPLANRGNISIRLIDFVTAKLRARCKRICFFAGNFAPLIHPVLQITDPNLKGCKKLANLIELKTFEVGQW